MGSKVVSLAQSHSPRQLVISCVDIICRSCCSLSGSMAQHLLLFSSKAGVQICLVKEEKMGGRGSGKEQKKENGYIHKTCKYVCHGFLSEVDLTLVDGCVVSHWRTNIWVMCPWQHDDVRETPEPHVDLLLTTEKTFVSSGLLMHSV